MKSKVFLYKEYDAKIKLFIGGLSTIDGLMLFNEKEEIQLITFGATSYKTYGWTTQSDLPTFKVINDLIVFFENEPDVGLIEFEIEFSNGDNFSSHDDGECKFILNSKEKIFTIIRSTSTLIYQDKFLSTLIENQNKYLTIDENGIVQIFFTYDDYLNSSKI